MSKLSVHISPGRTDGFGDFLTKCAAANSPVGIVYAVNQSVKPDILKYSPTTKFVYRRQTDQFNRQPPNFFEGDPSANCYFWFTSPDKADHNRTLLQNWAMNPADFYDPLNESVPDTPDKMRWLNAWTIQALNIARAGGFKLALASTPTGSPPNEMWQYFYPALRLGKAYGAILNLHAYWEGLPDSNNALRYRQFYPGLPEDCKLPIIISEASPGNGYGTGLTGQPWVNNMALYDANLKHDPFVLGACGFQLGGSESNMREALPAYGDYIASHPTPAIVPPPAIGYPRNGVIVSLGAPYHFWNLRATPSPDAEDSGDIFPDTLVYVLGENGNYYRIKLSFPGVVFTAYIVKEAVLLM